MNTAAKRAKRFSRMPGDPPRDEMLARMIRVDQAGEYGAKRIYDGQLAVLGRSKDGPVLREMAAVEERHLETFNELMVRRRVRPTVLMPVWHVAGFALGAGTALMGREAAMACTVASSSSPGTHSVMRPISAASGALIRSPVSRYRRARA